MEDKELAWEIGTQYANEPPWQIHLIMLRSQIKPQCILERISSSLRQQKILHIFNWLMNADVYSLTLGTKTQYKLKITTFFVAK